MPAKPSANVNEQAVYDVWCVVGGTDRVAGGGGVHAMKEL